MDLLIHQSYTYLTKHPGFSESLTSKLEVNDTGIQTQRFAVDAPKA